MVDFERKLNRKLSGLGEGDKTLKSRLGGASAGNERFPNELEEENGWRSGRVVKH